MLIAPMRAKLVSSIEARIMPPLANKRLKLLMRADAAPVYSFCCSSM